MMSVLRRPVLFLSALATVTVPGTLATFAVLGHQHGGIASSGPAVSRAGQQANLMPGPTPSTAARARPSSRVQVMQPRSAVLARARARGLQLLQRAAAAGQSASYQGMETIGATTIGGHSTVIAAVWHHGTTTVTQVPGGQPYADDASRAKDEIFGVSGTLVALLAKHYTALYSGADVAAGRPAFVVTVLGSGGATAARFWVDQRTSLTLRKDVYDTSSRLVSDERFVRVKFGTTILPKVVTGRGDQWSAASSPMLVLRQLNGPTTLVPVTLPGNLDLYAAARASTSAGDVSDLGFSDGLSVVSLFVQRGTLPSRMPGWQATTIAGRRAYVTQHEVALSGKGYVYTVLADAPPQEVTKIVGVLPRDSGPGILGRLSRGLGRIVTVLDPFQ